MAQKQSQQKSWKTTKEAKEYHERKRKQAQDRKNG